MRGSFDALAGAVRRLGLDPVDGHLYLFLNKARRLAKALWFDGSGWCVLAKRLEASSFQLPALNGDAAIDFAAAHRGWYRRPRVEFWHYSNGNGAWDKSACWWRTWTSARPRGSSPPATGPRGSRPVCVRRAGWPIAGLATIGTLSTRRECEMRAAESPLCLRWPFRRLSS